MALLLVISLFLYIRVTEEDSDTLIINNWEQMLIHRALICEAVIPVSAEFVNMSRGEGQVGLMKVVCQFSNSVTARIIKLTPIRFSPSISEHVY